MAQEKITALQPRTPNHQLQRTHAAELGVRLCNHTT